MIKEQQAASQPVMELGDSTAPNCKTATAAAPFHDVSNQAYMTPVSPRTCVAPSVPKKFPCYGSSVFATRQTRYLDIHDVGNVGSAENDFNGDLYLPSVESLQDNNGVQQHDISLFAVRLAPRFDYLADFPYSS